MNRSHQQRRSELESELSELRLRARSASISDLEVISVKIKRCYKTLSSIDCARVDRKISKRNTMLEKLKARQNENMSLVTQQFENLKNKMIAAQEAEFSHATLLSDEDIKGLLKVTEEFPKNVFELSPPRIVELTEEIDINYDSEEGQYEDAYEYGYLPTGGSSIMYNKLN